MVFAASSLQDALNAAAAELEEKVSYNFSGSRTLVTQLTQGARADVLATADQESMQAAAEAGLVDSADARVFTINTLVVATAPESLNVKSLQDLAKPGVRLVLADESVPAGQYALQVLDKLTSDPTYGVGYKERVLANVVSKESNVRQTLAKVRLGEADAALIYSTDVRSAAEVGTMEIPSEHNVVARYSIAPLKEAANRQAAFLFIGYLLSEEGQALLARHGFGPAEEK
jgi:molybdate transport system substrate-binding protein